MSRDIEAALDESFDAAHLAVYGDALQTRGDPRGDLIAIDLHIREHGITRELYLQRQELLLAWLGDSLTLFEQLDATIEYGFISDLQICKGKERRLHKVPQQILDLPAAQYIRGITIFETQQQLPVELVQLIAKPPRWLRRLTLSNEYYLSKQLMSAKRTAAFIAATPALEVIELRGSAIFGELIHPSVKTLRVMSPQAFSSLVGNGPPLPITTLELGYWYADFKTPGDAKRLLDLSPARLPHLRTLDLTFVRLDTTDSPPPSPFAWLRETNVTRHVRELRLPELRDASDVAEARGGLSRMPELEDVILTRTTPSREVPFEHPHARIRFSRWPSSIAGRVAFNLFLDDGVMFGSFLLAPIARYLDSSFDTLPESVRDAWRELITLIESTAWSSDTFSRDKSVDVSTPIVLRALDVLDVARHSHLAAIVAMRRRLHERLHKLPAVLKIR